MVPGKDIDSALAALTKAKKLVGDKDYRDDGTGVQLESEEGTVIVSTDGEVVFKPSDKKLEKAIVDEQMNRYGRVFNGPKSGVCPACGK